MIGPSAVIILRRCQAGVKASSPDVATSPREASATSPTAPKLTLGPMGCRTWLLGTRQPPQRIGRTRLDRVTSMTV